MTSRRYSVLAQLALMGLLVMPGEPQAATAPAKPLAPKPVIKPSPPPKPVLVVTPKASSATKSSGPGAKTQTSSKGRAGLASNTVPAKPPGTNSSSGTSGTQAASGPTAISSSGDSSYKAGK